MTRELSELPKQYDPSQVEGDVYSRWLDTRAFDATPDGREGRYVIMMPLPNVTGALHMGHAMDNVMQDLLTRWHRMIGDNSLWMAGTDHAGIATQAVVEKRLLELEGKTRHDIGREGLVERIWQWKDQFQKRIVSQQQAMGCSCDWNRQRFTMDAICARAVRWTFFSMFRDGLIFRGNRLVNWDCHLRTAVSDDEVYHEEIQGHFWHLRYPVIDPQPGEPEFIVVATTRPETMLGDTAVACHPDPGGALEKLISEARSKLENAGKKDRASLETQLETLQKRQETHLPVLETLADMAAKGREVQLPLLERPIPIITDVWAKPELGSGCVKITPGHDPNDYEVWTRHRDEIDSINILNTDGTLNENAGPYQGLERFEARKRVVADFESARLLEAIEDRLVEVGHSDRSKTAVEPYLSTQWFVRMSDVEGGVVCGRGTAKEFRAPGLAQAAMDAANGEWKSPTDRDVSFHPDVRYRDTYLNWLSEKRDWCISRQLWWGHQIPIWTGTFSGQELQSAIAAVQNALQRSDVFARIASEDGNSRALELDEKVTEESQLEILVCLRDENTENAIVQDLVEAGFTRDPDVLDTWFSSGLWPHSTLGWPDPATAAVEDGQSPLGPRDKNDDCLSYYYPGSCLVTGRDIITLWVARMVLMGLYNIGDLPFTDVFIHATILDGKGERMSKSKGNGIDPVDIIERYGTDALRYVLCEMQTGMQDIRLPVQAISPHTGNFVDLATAKHGQSIFTYMCPESGKEFDVSGTMPEVPSAKLISERFEVGRNFCNKLLNAARFAMLNLEEVPFAPRKLEELSDEDRWVLSRLSRAISAVHNSLESYNPSAAISSAREFFWSELCDWYLEFIKPRLRDASEAPLAQQVLAVALDQVLRLLHPFVPFITEMLWERLNERAPQRGIESALQGSELLIHAPWPDLHSEWQDDSLEEQMSFLQEVTRAIRDVRGKYGVAPSKRLEAGVRASGDAAANLQKSKDLLTNIAGLESLEISADVQRASDAATAVVGEIEIFVSGVVDLEKEKARLAKQRDQLQKRVEGAGRKLSNENFLQKANPEVVERERARLGELEAELKVVEENLRGLESAS